MSKALALCDLDQEDYRDETRSRHGPRPVKPLIPGVVVEAEPLWGCLFAMERMSEAVDDPNPVVRLTHDVNRLVLEYICEDIWASVKLRAQGPGTEWLRTVLPLPRVCGVAGTLSSRYRTIEVGADDWGVGLGPLGIPYIVEDKDFPVPPELAKPDTRVVIPKYYVNEIRTRVSGARRTDGPARRGASVGVMMDFDHYQGDQGESYQPVFVGMDSYRMHIWRPMEALTESQEKPFGVSIPAFAFDYLRAMHLEDIVRVEVSQESVVFGGNDYFLRVPVRMLGMLSVEKWRTVEPRYPGGWVVDRKQLLGAFETIASVVDEGDTAEVWLAIDEMLGEIHISMWDQYGHRYREVLESTNDGGTGTESPIRLNVRYMQKALLACRSNLVRLEVGKTHPRNVGPVAITDGESFRAVVMPLQVTQ